MKKKPRDDTRDIALFTRYDPSRPSRSSRVLVSLLGEGLRLKNVFV